jgi:peroxiredoxin
MLNMKKPYEVKGSEASETLAEFLFSSNEQLTRIIQFTIQADSLRSLPHGDSLARPVMAERQEATVAYHDYVNHIINDSKSPVLTLFTIGTYQTYAFQNGGLGLIPFTEKEVNGMIAAASARYPEHTGLAQVKASINSQKQEEAASSILNKQAPDFTLPDINGKPVPLSSLRGKYVLVDFWASWCKPCRDENPNVVKVFQQFRDKNFTVLGVSLDKEKDPWVKAIKDDQLNWTHVSDLKFWNSLIVPMYGIESIPYNVLLDPNGVVIADNLRGAALEAKLSEVIK